MERLLRRACNGEFDPGWHSRDHGMHDENDARGRSPGHAVVGRGRCVPAEAVGSVARCSLGRKKRRLCSRRLRHHLDNASSPFHLARNFRQRSAHPPQHVGRNRRCARCLVPVALWAGPRRGHSQPGPLPRLRPSHQVLCLFFCIIIRCSLCDGVGPPHSFSITLPRFP